MVVTPAIAKVPRKMTRCLLLASESRGRSASERKSGHKNAPITPATPELCPPALERPSSLTSYLKHLRLDGQGYLTRSLMSLVSDAFKHG